MIGRGNHQAPANKCGAIVQGLGREILNLKTRVRFPLALPNISSEEVLEQSLKPNFSITDSLVWSELFLLLSTRVDPLQHRRKEKLLQAEQSGENFDKVGQEWYGK